MGQFVYIIAVDGEKRAALRAQLATASNLLVQGFATPDLFVDGIGHRDAGVIVFDLPQADARQAEYIPVLGSFKESFATIVTISAPSVAVAVAAIKAGACDVVVLPAAAGDLARRVDDAAAVQRAAARRHAVAAEAATLLAQLTSRENEVLRLLADGLANRDVAARLGISLRTAEVHRARIMAKLGVGSLAQALRLGYACGALPLHPTPSIAVNT